METKICSKCKQEKPISEFAINRTRKDGHASDCKACRKIYRDKHYLEHKEYYKDKASKYRRKKNKEFEELRSTLKCSICGESRHWCLEFHHLNPNEKESEVTRLKESPRKLKEELKKCVVLCANCHRDIHYKERNMQGGKDWYPN